MREQAARLLPTDTRIAVATLTRIDQPHKEHEEKAR